MLTAGNASAQIQALTCPMFKHLWAGPEVLLLLHEDLCSLSNVYRVMEAELIEVLEGGTPQMRLMNPSARERIFVNQPVQ